MRRAARTAARALMVLIALLALTVGSTFTALRTGWGASLALRLALPRVNAAIAGHLDVGSLVFGGDHLVLEGLVLRDPEGDVVARVRKIAVVFSPLPLLREHVAASRIDVAEPTLLLHSDARGLNLARAVAARHPGPVSAKPSAQTQPRGRGLVIDVRSLVVSDGRVALRSSATPVEIASIAIAASGHYDAASPAFVGDLRLDAALRAPLRAPVALRVRGEGRGERRELAVSSSVGESSFEAVLQTESSQRAAVRLGHAVVAPELVRAFLPQVRLLGPVRLTGGLRQEGMKVTLGLEGADGEIDVRGEADVAERRVHDVSIRAAHLDLGRWLGGLPRSDLSLTVTGGGGGPDLTALTGELAFSMPQGQLDGASIGPASIRVAATGGVFDLRALSLALPGLDVAGSGALGPGQLGLEIKVDAADLARTSATLASFRDLGAPRFGGRGELDLSITGTSAAPGIAVTATFPRLDIGEDALRGVKLSAEVPRVHTPERATVDIRVASAHVSGRALRDVAVRVRSTPRRLNVEASSGAPLPLSLKLAGAWTRPRQVFELAALELRYPEATWRLQRTARLALRSDHLALTGLDLRARGQRIRADLDKRGERLSANVTVDHLDLGALPRVLVPPGLSLAGQLDVHADVAGRLRRPAGRVSVRLSGGRVGRYKNLALRLDGQYGGERAKASLEAVGLGTSARARFDVPMSWPPPDARAPLEMSVTVPETDLATLDQLGVAAMLPFAGRVGGKVALSLDVRGTSGAPSLALATTVRRLVIDHEPLGDVSLQVGGTPARALHASLEIGAAAAGILATPPSGTPASLSMCTGSLDVRTGLSLAKLLERVPTSAELLRTHFEVSGELRGLPLRTAARLAQSPLASGGTASVRLAGEGTALQPEGALNVEVAGMTGPRLPPTDGRLDVAFGTRDTRVAARVVRGGHELASASAVLGLPSRRLTDRAAVAGAPLTLRAALGPLRLQRADVASISDVGPPETFSAKLSAALAVDGTASRPSVKLTADVWEARLGSTPLGHAQALVTYADRRAEADVRFDTTAGSELRLAAHSAADLGYPQVMRGLKISEVPLFAQLTAQRFELGGFSGLSSRVRRVSGQLDAAVTVKGTLGTPSATGQLEWNHGALSLTGLGDYRDVHLKAHGDESAIWLDDLRLASGEGTAKLTAGASKTGPRAYELTAYLTTRRFPIYGQGQPLAVASLDGNLKGATTSTEAKAVLKLSEAHVELTDAKRKDLQSLSRPSDVVLVDDGMPIDRGERSKLAALSEELGSHVGEQRAKSESPPTQPPFALHLAIDAPRNLWVHGNDASLELGLGSDFHITEAGAPRIFGQVLVRRGRIDVLGRRFDLQVGSVVDFIGPPDTPRLDVSAKYFNDTENITVMLTAKGTLDHLAITVSSPERPDLTEGQLYTLIVTGRLQLGGNTAGSASPSGQAASLVGGVVAAQLQKALAKRLPLDVLTLDAGEGLTGSRLEAGTYLTSKLYAGYVGRVGANPALLQNRNAVHLEYQLSRRWSFDGEYGDVGTGTADLIWTKNY